MKKMLEKMDKYLAGLTAIDKIPDALYIADMRTEKTALAETQRTGIPVVAVCDTNTDPTKVNYAIPANDDAVNSIKMIADLVSEAINEGKKEFERKKAEVPKEEKKLPEAPKKERRALKKDESI